MTPRLFVPTLTRLIQRAAWFPPLLLRIILADVFLESGWHKVGHLADTIEFFSSLGIPLPQVQVPFVAAVELFGGGCLLLGLFTRFAAVPLIGTMVVALATAKRQDIVGISSLTEITEFLYLAMLIALIGSGAGWASVDRRLEAKPHD